MAQVVFIHPTGPLAGIIQLNLSNLLGLDVVAQSSAAQAKQYLKLSSQVDLIITIKQSYTEDTAEEIVKFKKDENLNAKVLVLGPFQSESPDIKVLPSFNDWNEIIDTVRDFINVSVKEKSDYSPISANFFLHMKTSPCDVYIKVKDNYVKRYHANDTYSHKDIIKYLDNGLKNFYVNTSSKDEIANLISNKLLEELEKEKAGTNINLTGEAFFAAKGLLSDVGIKTSSTQLVEGVLEAISVTLNDSNNVKKKMIDDLLASKSSRFYKLSHMISLVACEMLELADWANDDQKYTMSFAAFFHDITLSDEAMIFINSVEMLNASSFRGIQEREMIMNHALDATKIVKEYPNAPLGADELILRHHGVPHGVGFYDGIPDSANSLEIVFMIAEEFSNEVMKAHESNSSARKEEIIKLFYVKYSSEKIKQIVELLEKTFA